MSRCMDPNAFRVALAQASQRYHKVMIVKYWNTCCASCSAATPVLRLDSNMNLSEVTLAHGLSLQGVVKMIQSLGQNDNPEIVAIIATLTRSIAYTTRDTPKRVRELSTKLSQLYNTIVSIDNGSVIEITTVDSSPLRVVLQGMLLVNDCDLRQNAAQTAREA